MIDKICRIFIKNSQDVNSPKVRDAYGKLTSFSSVLCNVLLFIIKVLAGVISGSVSIIADAINNLFDASSNVISYLGFKLGSRPADLEHPYGHGRYEYIAGFIVSFLVVFVGVELFKSGVQEIINPTTITLSTITFVILIISIFVKLFMALFNYKIGKKIKSDVLIASALDSRNDILATSSVLIALVISYFTNVNLDGYMTIAVALFIIFSGVILIKDTLGPILGKAPEKELVQAIKDKVLSYEGVLGIHDLLIHDYGVGRQFGSVHIEMSAEDNPLKSHEIIDGIEKDVLEELNVNLVIHYDPISIANEEINELREYISEKALEIDSSLSVHDVRVVYGIDRNIVIFDIVIPYTVKIQDKEVKNLMFYKIKEKYPLFDANITIDKSYV